MIKRYLYVIGAIVSLWCGGCSEFLDIQPENQYTEDQVFSSEKSMQDALNGLYNRMAGNDLYGANLTSTTVELIGQRYNPVSAGSSNNYLLLQQYGYQQTAVQETFEGIWTSAYQTILAVNNFLTKMEPAVGKGVLSEEKARQLRGELLGMRAFLHVDLLRLFGPTDVHAESPAIPYYTEAQGEAAVLLSAQEVLNQVLADLLQAEELLSADPVINLGIVSSGDFYSAHRNLRFNLYAIRGLLARVYLYQGDKQQAHNYALSVLENGGKWFPWLPYTDILSTANPDRIFSPEVIFGVYNLDMYTNYQSYFGPDLLDNALLAPHPDRLANTFENNENDYRYTTTWLNSAKGFRTFFKYADVLSDKPWRFIQPLLRKTELYYILAETESDPVTALSYLNLVRNHRGLTELPPTVDLSAEITKEYQKEFWGEGQIFYYYKRLNMARIPSGINGISTVAPVYQVPLPLSETTPR